MRLRLRAPAVEQSLQVVQLLDKLERQTRAIADSVALLPDGAMRTRLMAVIPGVPIPTERDVLSGTRAGEPRGRRVAEVVLPVEGDLRSAPPAAHPAPSSQPSESTSSSPPFPDPAAPTGSSSVGDFLPPEGVPV